MGSCGRRNRPQPCLHGENYAVSMPFCLYLESVEADSEAADMDSAAEGIAFANRESRSAPPPASAPPVSLSTCGNAWK